LFSLLGVCFAHRRFGCSKSPANEPLEGESQDELGYDYGENEYQRDVEHYFGGNASDAFCVDRSDFDDLSKAPSNLFVIARRIRSSYVHTLYGWVPSNILEPARPCDLRCVEPVQKVQIQYISSPNHQVAGAVPDILPSEVHISRGVQTVESFTSIGWSVALIPEVRPGCGIVELGRAILVEQLARHVPCQIVVVVSGNVTACRAGDEAFAGSIDILEEKASVLSSVLFW
jgi:hypothetical protein